MNPYPGMVFNPVTRSYVTQAEADAYMAIQRVHEANMKKQAEENCDSESQAQPEPLTTRNLERDLEKAIKYSFSLKRILDKLHPDVKKIINLGELLNEPR